MPGYYKTDCECSGYNHECPICDGVAQILVCEWCNGTGIYKDFGPRVWVEWAKGYGYPHHKPPVHCPYCKEIPMLKLAHYSPEPRVEE